jgi:LmbE family N-acetylglucosaminyl deacetylase
MPTVLESIAAVDARYQHVYFSPHLDDAVLSCGATIAQHARESARVLVVTACAGAPPVDLALGTFGKQLHEEWGLSLADVSTARRREDQAAAARVGADVLWLDFLDAIYRDPKAYAGDKDALFGPAAPDDPLPAQLAEALAEIAACCPGAALHAPLGVGLHVDHRAVHAAAVEVGGRAVSFYDDYPYVAYPGALERRLETLGGAASWTATVRPIDDTLADRIEAIRLYRSQIGLLFGDEEIMTLFVTEYARSLCPANARYGERSWTPSAR